MTTIPQRVLRNDIAEILRRAEAGERFTVTVSGRPVAELGPVQRPYFASGEALRAALNHLDPPVGLMEDLRQAGGGVVDPFG